MKNGWQTKKVSEIAKHSLGKMLDKAKNKGEPKPYLRNLNVRWFDFDLSDVLEMRFLPEEAARYTAVKGDVLICEGGYPGRAAIWEQDEPIYFQKALHRVRFHEPERNKWFLYYLLSKDLDGSLKSHFNGAGIQHFTGEALAQFEVPLPPLPEQQRIVGLLDAAFAGLATAKANAAKNLQNARALFESHLQSVFTQRGKGWVEKKLESLGAIRTGKRDANHQVENGPYPFYTCAFGQFRSPTFSFDGASIILPGNGANVGKVFFHDGKFEAYQRTYVVNELSQSINPRFLYYCFSANWPGWIATKQFGSATNYIVVGDLKAFPVPTPPLPVQEETVEQLESFTEETQRLATLYTRKLAALEALKKSLLHQAFTGQLSHPSHSHPILIP